MLDQRQQKQLLVVIKEKATAHGLLFLGALPLSPEETFPNFKSWLDAGMHGDMQYMMNFVEVREDPRKILQGATSTFTFAYRYGKKERFRNQAQPLIAQYARTTDYHRFLRRDIETVMKESLQTLAINDQGRAFVDTAPVLERALAAKHPKVFVGKNTCLIHEDEGSFLLLGQWISTLALEADPVAPNESDTSSKASCGSCLRCQTHCPTNAFIKPFVLDARRCISYWTIENRGEIPRWIWPHLATYVYGCDICQNVCPFNRTETHPLIKDLRQYEFPDLLQVVQMSQREYEEFFGGSPMTRAKRSGLRRNALIAMYMRADTRISEALHSALSSDDAILIKTAQTITNEMENR